MEASLWHCNFIYEHVPLTLHLCYHFYK